MPTSDDTLNQLKDVQALIGAALCHFEMADLETERLQRLLWLAELGLRETVVALEAAQ